MTPNSQDAICSIVFSGHMIDLPGRQESRFPPELEAAAREAIRTKTAAVMKSACQATIGYASGAQGGDILFHEECRAAGLRTVVVLPFPADTFERTSVEGIPGSDWVARFRKLWRGTMPDDRICLGLRETDESYGRCNAYLLELARKHGRFHLIALWNGNTGDGPGGTSDMVSKARRLGDRPDIIDPRRLS